MFDSALQKPERSDGNRGELRKVVPLLETGRRMNLQGWVLFPTRDEHVAAFARHRGELSKVFRVPTPEWEVVKWAWNKWNTYCLAQKLAIPIPRTWCPKNLEEIDKIDAEFPIGVKLAVKEDFFYATKAKAWRANSRDELKELFSKASTHVGSNEVLVQEIIPGDGSCQFSSCMFFKNGVAIGSRRNVGASIRQNLAGPLLSSKVSIFPKWKNRRFGFFRPSTTTAWRKSSTNWTRAAGSSSFWM